MYENASANGEYLFALKRSCGTPSRIKFKLPMALGFERKVGGQSKGEKP